MRPLSPRDSERPIFDRVAGAFLFLPGWWRLVVGVVAGGISAFALAPFNLFPLLWLTVPAFVWLIDGAVAAAGSRRLRRLLAAGLVGWAFGFGYFLGGLWWIGAAFLVEADVFAWLLPIAVLALPAGLAVFWGLGAALAGAVWTTGWRRIVLFAVALSVAEWLRGHALTGFPWNAFGYALAPTAVMMQSAALIGLWGLTLVAFLVFAAPAAMSGVADGGAGRGRTLFAVAATALLLAHVGYGAARMAGAGDGRVPDVRLRIVQPAIDQRDKWNTDNESAIVERYLRLSDTAPPPGPAGDGPTIVIWPESAFPFLLAQRPSVIAAIANMLPPETTLITGAARAGSATGSDDRAAIFNSVLVIADDGVILDAYDKTHLVPFGEYLPFRDVLETIGFRQLIALPGGFAAGDRRRTMRLVGAPDVGPLICYEIIFPGAVTDPDRRPGWLLNVTNDGWYGLTPGPYQHFHQARLRAVEEGLPVVRAANSGISAIVDPYGRVVASLGLGQIGIVDGNLPVALALTPYARLGETIYLALIFAGMALAKARELTFG